MTRSRGAIYAFGNAYPYVPRPISACDPVVAIFAHPKTQGFRLVTLSGATLPFGGAPGGNQPTGKQVQCPPANPPTMSLAEYNSIQGALSYDQVANSVGGPATLVSATRFRALLAEEARGIAGEAGEDASGALRYAAAAELFERLATAPECPEFLTLMAYEQLDPHDAGAPAR